MTSRPVARTTSGAVVAGVLVALVALVPAPASAAAPVVCPGPDGPGGSLSGVVNRYFPGVGTAAAGATSIDVGGGSGAATPIAVGDVLLVIQVQDAQFDSSNTGSYGHGGAAADPASGFTALGATGSYEYVTATSAVVAGTVTVQGAGAGGGLLHAYTTAAATGVRGQRTFEVVRVPSYTTATTSSGLTALAWDGSVGGVLAVDVANTLTLAGTVSVDGLGFRGGAGIQRGGAPGHSNADTAVSATAGVNGNKAEGIAGTPLGTTAGDGYPGGDTARGAPGNAGGGGTDADPAANDENSGGGGGGNGGRGGVGGNSWNSNLATGGWGGAPVPAAGTRAVLGGGGGAGTANNFTAPAASGAAGGGIVLVRAGRVAGAGTITADGADAYQLTPNDGGGGGGAGGTIVLSALAGGLGAATLHADGGRGGDAWATQPPGAGNISAHGPGGGGGGGTVLTSSAAGSTTVGGAHGTTTTSGLQYGSTDGAAGQTGTATPQGVVSAAHCADLAIAKTGPATLVGGQQATYRLTVRNLGNATATGVSVTDTLAVGVTFVSAKGSGWACTHAGDTSVTCTRATLAVGTAPVITVVVTTPPAVATLTDSAQVSATSTDPDPSDNATSATTVTSAPPELSDTGADVVAPTLVGLALVALGSLLVAVARRRPSPTVQ